MPVIAMTREMGSLGKDVALGLAERLGVEIVHHELVEHNVAERAGVEASAVHRYLEGTSSLLERWKLDRNRLALFTAEEILALATRGNVLIRGWGANHLLRNISNAVCLRVCAPMPFRVQVMMRRLGIQDEAVARHEIELNDVAHSATIEQFFGGDWRNPELYDIVLNTERTSIATCVAQVVALTQSPEFLETEASRKMLADKLAKARDRSALNRYGARGLAAPMAAVSGGFGSVTLPPVATNEEAIARIERHMHGANDVTSAKSRSRLPPTLR